MLRLNPIITHDLQRQGTVSIRLEAAVRDAIGRAFQTAADFFHAPQEQKLHHVLAKECGYRARGIEYSASPDHPDEIESFTSCPRVHPSPDELELPSARALYEQMETVFLHLEEIAEAITIEMATVVSHNSHAERLAGGLHRWSRLQLNYSRPSRTAGANIHDLHEDGNLLTLACATAPGLEVRDGYGNFFAVAPTYEEVLVMPGETAWLLSGGEIQPAWHRVRPDAETDERMALMLFADLNPALCEPWVRTAVNAGIDIGDRVLRTDTRFGLKGLTPE